MAKTDAPGVGTICERGRTGLYADDLGVTVRNSSSSTARFAWAEIECFTDGRQLVNGGYCWVLVIVSRTGRRIRVACTLRTGQADPETLEAVRQVADRRKIPADLTGVPMTDDGRPVYAGLYEDPGGRAGLRYWDGTQWSPLLPMDLKKAGWGWDRTKGKSAGLRPDFPVADGTWNYAAGRARRWAIWLAFLTVVTAALLAVGLTIWLGRDHGSSHQYVSPTWWFISAAIAVVIAVALPVRAWTFYRKVDKASRASIGR